MQSYQFVILNLTHIYLPKVFSRGLIGVCMQEDLLWDDMLVIEHLEFMSRLRGSYDQPSNIGTATDRSARKAAFARETEQLIIDGGLGDHVQKRTRELSGGWKRYFKC